MQQVLLDTSFILTCIKQKIDFFEEIKLKGMEILIPKQVIEEIKRISESKKKLRFREYSKLALKILKKTHFKKIDLKEKNTDNGIVKFAEKNKSIIVATLDRELKEKIPNQKLIIRQRKILEVI